MSIFRSLKQLSDYRRRHLPFLQTLVDLELVREVGFHQVNGTPLTLKVLFQQGIGSVATVQRRMNRLKRLGVVRQTRTKHDARSFELTLSPQVWAIYSRMEKLMRKGASCSSES